MKVSGSAETWSLHQWANDWITADGPNGRTAVLSPTRVQLEGEEISEMLTDRDHALAQIEAGEYPHTGFFWKAWSLDPRGFFTARRPESVPSL